MLGANSFKSNEGQNIPMWKVLIVDMNLARSDKKFYTHFTPWMAYFQALKNISQIVQPLLWLGSLPSIPQWKIAISRTFFTSGDALVDSIIWWFFNQAISGMPSGCVGVAVFFVRQIVTKKWLKDCPAYLSGRWLGRIYSCSSLITTYKRYVEGLSPSWEIDANHTSEWSFLEIMSGALQKKLRNGIGLRCAFFENPGAPSVRHCQTFQTVMRVWHW